MAQPLEITLEGEIVRKIVNPGKKEECTFIALVTPACAHELESDTDLSDLVGKYVRCTGYFETRREIYKTFEVYRITRYEEMSRPID